MARKYGEKIRDRRNTGMFCEKCGKEISEGAAFCDNCGAKLKKKKKSSAAFIGILLVLLLAAGAGGYWYLNSDGYQCGKQVKLAEECMEKGAYEEALTYYEAALKLDPAFVDAYVRSADAYLLLEEYEDAISMVQKGIENAESSEETNDVLFGKLEEAYQAEADAYLTEEAYGEAVAVLQRGLENMDDLDAPKEALSDKLEEVYAAEAEHLVGTWFLQYDLLSLLPIDIGKIEEAEMGVFFEFQEDNTLRIYVDKEFVDEKAASAAGGVATGVTALAAPAGIFAPILGGAAGAVTKWLPGFIAGNVSIYYTYEMQGEILYCRNVKTETGSDTDADAEVGQSVYSFTMNGNTLQLLEEEAESESPLAFVEECPAELERLEE